MHATLHITHNSTCACIQNLQHLILCIKSNSECACIQDLQQLVRLVAPLLDQLQRYDNSILEPCHRAAALQALIRRVRDRLIS